MSEFVRLGDITTEKLRVGLEVFEQRTRGQYPWAQKDPAHKKIQRFGLCPECNNAMLLVNIDNPDPQVTPHGRHRLRQVNGFEHCLEDILACTLLDRRLKSDLENEIAALTPDAVELREFLVENFNLVVGMFSQETGIAPSEALALKMRRLFFEHRWYRWPTVTKGNLPWTFARLTCNFNLYKQRVRPRSDVWKAVHSRIPHAVIGRYGLLEGRGAKRIYLEFGLGQHKVTPTRYGPILETISLHVLNTDPAAAGEPPVFEKTLPLRTKEFLMRVDHKTKPEGFGAELVEVARETLAEYVGQHPEAQSADLGA